MLIKEWIKLIEGGILPGTNRLQNTNGTSNLDYSYDPNGNVTASNPRSLIFTYDKYFNLPASTTLLTNVTRYLYGAGNERVAKISDVGAAYDFKTIYIHGLSDYPLMENNYYPDGSYGTFLYIYGPTGLIAVNDNNNEWNFILKDHLGSTRMVINSSNEKITKYDYTPFGSHMNSTLIGLDVQHQFTGQERDEEIDLLNFRARFYDSRIGIFYAGDPAGQGFSPYMYCGGNPVMRIDKDGRWFWEIFQIISTAYSIYQGFVNGGEEGALKNAVIAGVGGAFSQIGGGTFLENFGYGVAEGGITGGLSDALWGGNGSGIWKGAIIGGGFAAITSGIEAYKNFSDYGQFKTDSDLLGDLMSLQNNEEAAIYFAQNRYGFDDVSVTYDSKMKDNYGVTSPDGTIKLGFPALRSSDDLKITLAHEWSHSKFDRLLDNKGNFISWKNSVSFETGPVNPANGLKPPSLYDGPSGYPAEVTLSGKLHISLSYMTRIDLATNGMLYYNVLSWHSMGIEKWWYWLPKR